MTTSDLSQTKEHSEPDSFWCEICGDCTCPSPDGRNLTVDDDCPLHGADSEHSE